MSMKIIQITNLKFCDNDAIQFYFEDNNMVQYIVEQYLG